MCVELDSVSAEDDCWLGLSSNKGWTERPVGSGVWEEEGMRGGRGGEKEKRKKKGKTKEKAVIAQKFI